MDVYSKWYINHHFESIWPKLQRSYMTVLLVTLLKNRKDMPKRLPGVLMTPPSGKLPCEHMRQQPPHDCLAVDTGGTRPSSCQLRHRPGEAETAAGEDGKLPLGESFGKTFLDLEDFLYTWNESRKHPETSWHIDKHFYHFCRKLRGCR